MQRLFLKNTQVWEINRTGTRYLARWGDVTTKGESAVYDFASAQEARESIDALIDSLINNGYVEQAGTYLQRKDLKWSPALEAAILERPNEASTRLVYADWLQANGNPLGELIALQHAGQSGHDLIEDCFESFFGRHAARMRRQQHLSLEWQNGFVDDLHARAEGDGETMSSAVSAVLSSPAARFIRSIILGLSRDYEDYDAVPSTAKLLATVVAHSPQRLERLEVADFDQPAETEWWHSELGDASGLWQAAPALREILFRGAGLELGDIVAPQLRSFTVESDGLSPALVRSIVNAQWPKLESLTLWLGPRFTGSVSALQPILEMRSLTTLGFKNTELTDLLIAALADSKVLPQLRTLDLSKGTMTAAGAQVLRSRAARFRHLESLDLTENRHDVTAVLRGLDLKVRAR